MDAYLATIKAKTGKTPEDFKQLADEKGLEKHGDMIAWLKADFDLGHGHANLIAHLIRQGDEPEESPDEAIAKHFEKAKAVWRVPYDGLMEKLTEFGDDVRASAGKTYINLLRGDKKFGIVQVSGKRMDIGIKRKGVGFEGRFEDSAKWNAMVTHRVQIEDASQIDDEVLAWLREAYENA